MTLTTGVDRYTVLYRLHDENDELLYVGITSCGPVRFQQHQGERGWFPLVATIRVEHYVNRDDAEVAEERAIGSECPRFNTQHGDLKKARRRRAERLFGFDWRRDLPWDTCRELENLRRRQRLLSRDREKVVMRARSRGAKVGHIAWALGTTSLEIERVINLAERQGGPYPYS